MNQTKTPTPYSRLSIAAFLLIATLVIFSAIRAGGTHKNCLGCKDSAAVR